MSLSRGNNQFFATCRWMSKSPGGFWVLLTTININVFCRPSERAELARHRYPTLPTFSVHKTGAVLILTRGSKDRDFWYSHCSQASIVKLRKTIEYVQKEQTFTPLHWANTRRSGNLPSQSQGSCGWAGDRAGLVSRPD